MIRTAVNVTGDLSASAVIARSEGETLIRRPIDHPLPVGPKP
jgi:Na+/H+-dicarboxylate symporter